MDRNHRTSRHPIPFWWSFEEQSHSAIRFWLVFLGCFCLLVFRGWDRVANPDLFAEDVRFIGDAFNHGWGSLLIAYDFFFHTAPRLVALLSITFAPTSHIPLFTTVVCYAITAAAMANISRVSYRWLIPSDGARVGLALLMTLAPGLTEILGNLAGIHWSLLLWLATLSLKDLKQPFSRWDLLVVVLTVLSAAGSIVFLPMAFVRLMQKSRTRLHTKRMFLSNLSRHTTEIVFFVILLTTTALLFLHFAVSESEVGTGELDIVEAFREIDYLLYRLAALFTAFYFLHPFLGTNSTSLVLYWWPLSLLFSLAVLISGLLLVRLGKHLGGRFWLIPTWLGCVFGLAVMLSIVRYWGFYGLFSPPYWDWWFRYNFVFACTGLVFMFILIRPENLLKIKQWPTLLTFALITGYVSQVQAVMWHARPPHENDAYAIKRYGTKHYWGRTADELERSRRTGCPATVKVVGHPNGRWSFVYKSPRTGVNCPSSSNDWSAFHMDTG